MIAQMKGYSASFLLIVTFPVFMSKVYANVLLTSFEVQNSSFGTRFDSTGSSKTDFISVGLGKNASPILEWL